MTREPLDPRVDMLIAALYGELSGEEDAKFRRLLEEDPAFRSEWEELSGTRRVLGAWKIEDEPAPSFVLVGDPSPARRRQGASLWNRLRESLNRYGAATGWAVATAAVLLAILALSDFRIDLMERGIAFRFGPPLSEPPQTSDAGPQGRPATSFYDPAVDGPSPLRTVAGESPYITRAESEARLDALLQVVNDMLQRQEYNAEQSRDLGSFTRAMYQGLNQKQTSDYYDLRSRIEALRMGMSQMQSTQGPRSGPGAIGPDVLDGDPGEPLVPEGPASKDQPQQEGENER